MKISAITRIPLKQFNNSNKNEENKTTSVSNNISNQLTGFAYRDYNISFQARLNRTPENFYEQPFNRDNMPDTVKAYLNEDFEERHHMPPAQLQREAFQYLKIADTIQDVKDMYPDEELFKKLRTVEETKPNTGILLLLQWDAKTSQTPIFKNKENKDLTVYLLKKVYLEGKTLDEINSDFDNDATDAIKRELGVKDKKYFSGSTMRTLGIRYPNLSYFNSFVATRNDKEYIPKTRESHTVTEETREKLSEASKKWWAGLNQIDREEQIQKMLEGKEMANSIFSKYQGQIMTIAAGKMGFSEKLSQIFSEKYSDETFKEDFATFAEQQREIMLEFWNKDPKFRQEYSDVLQKTIADFEEAYTNKDTNPEELEKLLNQAIEQKSKILNKARITKHQREEMKKLATPQPKEQELNTAQIKQQASIDINSKKVVTRLFKKLNLDAMKYFTDAFKKEMMDFIEEKTDYQSKKEMVAFNQPDTKDLLGIDNESFNIIADTITTKKEQLNAYFNNTHTLTAETNDIILNKVLYDLTKDPMVFKFERGDAMKYIEENSLGDRVLQQKEQMNKTMKRLAILAPKKDIEEFYNNYFKNYIEEKVNIGFKYYPEIGEAGINNLKSMVIFAKAPENERKKHLSKFNAAIKFINDRTNDPIAKEIVKEKMAMSYILWLLTQGTYSNPQNSVNKAPETDIASTGTKSISKNDLKSEYSTRLAFKDYIHDTLTKYWNEEAEQKFFNTAFQQDYLNHETMALYLVTKQGKLNSINKNMSKKDKKVSYHIAETLTKMLIEKYEHVSPQQAFANKSAINHLLYEMTGNPETLTGELDDSAEFIISHNLDKKFDKNRLNEKYKHFSKPLSNTEIQNFCESKFNNELENIHNFGLTYHPVNQQDTYSEVEEFVFNSLKNNTGGIKDKLYTYISAQRGSVEFIEDESKPEEIRNKLLENLVFEFQKNIAKELNKNFIKPNKKE